MPAKIDREDGGENRVAGLGAGNLLPDGSNFPDQFHAENVTPGLVPSQDQSPHKFYPATDGQVEAAHDRVTNGDGGGMVFDKNFTIPRYRFLHFLRLQHFRWSVLGVDNGFHFDNSPFL